MSEKKLGGSIKTPEPTGIVTPEVGELANRNGQPTVEELKAMNETERAKHQRPYNACPSCWGGHAGIGKVTSTPGSVRYMKCPICGWTWSIAGEPANSIRKQRG